MTERRTVAAVEKSTVGWWRHRSTVLEVLFWMAAFAAIVLLPRRLLLLNEIAILGLFALSLDLILGYAGIVSLGHAAFFGVGAYAAGLTLLHIHTDPLLALVVAAVAAGALGLITAFLVMRGTDLTRLMVTLGVALLLGEAANKARDLTGGADGLQGITAAPVLGLFRFDLAGRTAYVLSLSVLLVLFVVARRLAASPFGMTLRTIRDNPLRAAAIGVPVNRRLLTVYTIAAIYAGIAGGLAGGDDAVRVAGCVRVRAFGGCDAGAHSGWNGLSLWRYSRRDPIQGAVGRAVDVDAAVLAFLDRAAAGGVDGHRP